MHSEEKDSSDQYWQIESCNLQKAFDRTIRDLIESGETHHFSIFAFAPQPLLIQLRKLFTDRVHATAISSIERHGPGSGNRTRTASPSTPPSLKTNPVSRSWRFP